MQRGIWPPSVLGKTPWLLWGEGSARGPRQSWGQSITDRRWSPGTVREGHQGCSQTETSPGLLACGLSAVCSQASVPAPPGPSAVRMKVPFLSHSWTGPLCHPELQTSPPAPSVLETEQTPTPASPTLPGEEPHPYRQPPASGLERAGLGACGGRSGDRQPLAPPTWEGNPNTSVPPGT